MTNKINGVLMGFLIFGLAGCGTVKLTPEGQKVDVTKNEPTGCTQLETITTPLGDPNLLKIWLRNKAAEKGADTVVLESVLKNDIDTNVKYTAVIYKCPKK